MFRKVVVAVLMLLFLLFIPSAFALERQAEVSVAPLALTYGGYNIQGQYFIEPQISAGLEYYSWKFSAGSAELSTTTYVPFARYYWEANKDGWFGKAGYLMMSISAKMEGMSASGSFSGPLFGGGYNWLWENGFIIDLGYEVALISGSIEFDDGTTVPVSGGAGGAIFRVGYAF